MCVWRYRVCWMVGLGLCFGSASAQGQAPNPVGKGIDPATVVAYEKRGAVYGGFRPKQYLPTFFAGPEYAEKWLPGFRLLGYPHDGYPVVAVPFGLDLSGVVVTDLALKELATLKNLHLISLNETQVTDATLRALRENGLLHLLSLAVGKAYSRPWFPEDVIAVNLHNTLVTDAGLKELAWFKNLNRLYLKDCNVTDCTLRTLRELGFLPALSLVVSKGNDRPKKPQDAVSIGLYGTQVTDAGLKELVGFQNIVALNLTDLPITDAGLKDVALLKGLTKLYLGGTLVTDAGLKVLTSLNNLRTLQLDRTKTSPLAVAELRKAMPGCDIRR